MKYRILLYCLCMSLALRAQNIGKGKVIVENFMSHSIEGNRGGEDPMRRLTIYLPPGYDQSNRRYPVIYFLHGFPIDDSICMTDYRFNDLLDSGIQSGQLKSMIMVLPNSYTHFRASLYTNSALTGNWADYIAKDAVEYVDNKFRTIRDRKSRGLAGHSMGGLGAIKIGMMYSNVFSVIYSSSPGGLDWGPYFNIGNAAFKKLQSTTPDKLFSNFDNLSSDFATHDDFYAMLFTVFGRAFASEEKNLPFYGSLPVHYVGDSMIVDQAILRRWEENFPYNMIDTHIGSLKSLVALKLDWGRNDRIPFIPVNCIRFSKKLEAYGIDHKAEEYFGEHDDKISGPDGRLNTEMLPFFTRYLKFEEGVKIPAKSK